MINFLDLTISPFPNKFEFEVYRKTTATNILSHDTSFCPFPHKIIAFIHQLVSLPFSPLAFAKEISILKFLANANKVQVHIDELVQKKVTRVAL